MSLRLPVALLGAGNVGNAIWMLVAPASWYALPIVSGTGPMNPHFVTDIGLAYLASGIGMLLGTRRGGQAATLAFAGSVWPALHALFHLSHWLMHGPPASTALRVAELLAVLLPGLLGAALAWRLMRSPARG